MVIAYVATVSWTILRVEYGAIWVSFTTAVVGIGMLY